MVRRLWKIEPFMKCIIFRRKNDATVLHRPPVSCYAKLQKLIQNRYKQIFCWGMEIDNPTGSRERERESRRRACFFSISVSLFNGWKWRKSCQKSKVYCNCRRISRQKKHTRYREEKETLIAFIACMHFNSKKYRSCVLAAYECECECVYKFHCCVCMCELVSAIRR